MNKPKTKVVKSKSSNSAITTKSKSSRSHNKSISHVEIKPPVKKRGVYVEKKPTKLSISETVQRIPKSPKHVPRPGKKLFLNSVLTILSKCTTGTQFPDSNDIKKIDKFKFKGRRRYDENKKNYDNNTEKKKLKYRSKVLNDNKNVDNELIVLQSRRDISHSPSNDSERSRNPESIKWSEFLPPLVPKNDSATTVIDTSKIKAAIKQKRVTLIDNKDPVTLLDNESKKNDKNLYNFFVDLLETTFDVYNVNTELRTNENASMKSSKILFDVNKSLAKNVEETQSDDNFNNIKDDTLNCCSHESKNYNYILQNTPSAMNRGKRKIKSKSFEHKKNKPIPFSHSVTYQQSVLPFKKTQKKDHKRNFLNILKEELKMNSLVYEEPQSFFQALKVMAKNKRKHQNTEFNFNKEDGSECIFKRRKLLSYKSNSKKKNRNTKPLVTYTPNTVVHKCKKLTTESDSESSHSIKVYGIDYEPTKPNTYHNFDDTDCLSGNCLTNYKLNEEIFNFSDSSMTLC